MNAFLFLLYVSNNHQIFKINFLKILRFAGNLYFIAKWEAVFCKHKTMLLDSRISEVCL